MYRAGCILGLVFALTTFVCVADSIVLEGKSYNNVKIRESSTRYYIEIVSQGRSISVPKDQVDASTVVIDEDVYDPDKMAGQQVQQVEGAEAPLYAGASTLYVSTVTENNDRLEINALVLRSGDVRIAICSIDTCVVGKTFRDDVVQKLRVKRSEIGDENLMISATRAASGAFQCLIQGPIEETMFGDYSDDEFEYGAGRAVDAILTAEQNMRPARIRFGQGEAPGLTKNHALPDQPVDPTLLMAYVEDRDGNPLAYLVNYAAQPDFLREKGFKTGRDFPGGLATEIRRFCGAENIPVLFLNGAMGGVLPESPSGNTPAEKAFFMGKALAEVVLHLQQQSEPTETLTISHRTRNVDMPPHMLTKFIPHQVLLQDFWIGDVVFLSLPGEPTPPIGVELRKKAIAQGAKYAFLVGAANDYSAIHTDVNAYFKSEIEATLSFYGPLVISWYLDQHMPAPVLKPSEPWIYCSMIADNRQVFETAREKARIDSETIRNQWAQMDETLEKLQSILRRIGQLPIEAMKILEKVPPSDAIDIGKQYAAYYVRHEKASFTDKDWVTLMGAADGAQLPFDAIMMLQFMFNPAGLPKEAAAIFDLLEVKGIDFLGK
ncbi:MAG: hypothetical protein QG656_126 [Candidatus Hydrogenedentes bacterium]|nr:hypothetical protein [Candidatus Hydrogenedentota bacterium]